MQSKLLAREQYFFARRTGLQEVIAAFRLTKHGEMIICSDLSVDSYSAFSNVPLIEGETLAQAPLSFYIPSVGDLEFFSSGTNGARKRVFYPKLAEAMTYQHSLGDLVGESEVVIVHSRRYEREQFYWAHDATYARKYPNAKIVEYYDLQSAVAAVKEARRVLIYEYPSALYRFLHLLEQAVEAGLIHHEDIMKDAVIVELSGEPVNLKEIHFVRQRVRMLFGREPHIRVGYGLTETGGTGYFEYRPDIPEVAYRIADNVFVEVIDRTTKRPCLGRLGEIIVTPLRTRGTVLLRYRTGDLGILDFDEGTPYLSVKGKPPEAAIVYIAGSYFAVPSLVEALQTELGIPVQVMAESDVNKTTGTENLKITIGTTARGVANWSKLKRWVTKRIVEMAQLEAEVQMGIVNISVDVRDGIATNPGMRKAWRIIRREKGTEEEARMESEDPR